MGDAVMEHDVMNLIIENLANAEQIDETEMWNQMQRAIDHAFYSEDINIREQWQAVPRKGETPTVEELIAYISDRLK